MTEVNNTLLLSNLYHDVERELTSCLQPVGQGHRKILRTVETARNNLRKIMRKAGYKGKF